MTRMRATRLVPNDPAAPQRYVRTRAMHASPPGAAAAPRRVCVDVVQAVDARHSRSAPASEPAGRERDRAPAGARRPVAFSVHGARSGSRAPSLAYVARSLARSLARRRIAQSPARPVPVSFFRSLALAATPLARTHAVMLAQCAAHWLASA